MRVGLVALLITLGLLGALLLFSTGPALPQPEQVIGLAQGTGENRRILQAPYVRTMVIREALQAARFDRWRRWLPGARCQPMGLGFQTVEGWIDLELACSSGFLFDYISPEAWR